MDHRAPSVLRDLRLKASQVTELAGRAPTFVPFSRSGFRGLEQTSDLMLVDLIALVDDRMPGPG